MRILIKLSTAHQHLPDIGIAAYVIGLVDPSAAGGGYTAKVQLACTTAAAREHRIADTIIGRAAHSFLRAVCQVFWFRYI